MRHEFAALPSKTYNPPPNSMAEIRQNVLYLTTPGTYMARDHLTLAIEVPVYPQDLPSDERTRDKETGRRKLSLPIHHIESICAFGHEISISPFALDLCWENGVAVNYLGEFGHLRARVTGMADTSVLLRRTQFRAADDPTRTMSIARQMVAGKLQNSRNSLLRAAREAADDTVRHQLTTATDTIARNIAALNNSPDTASLRGLEGSAAAAYFNVFSHTLKQQKNDFAFVVRSRRPPHDFINCLLSFLYGILRHDAMAALTTVGLDPFVGFLHAERPNRPALALDLMEEFRPWLADRLAITLINRQQISARDFNPRPGGAVELTEAGRKRLLQAWQDRKREQIRHPLLDQSLDIGQLLFIQARILARHLRGDIPDYVAFVPK